MKNKDSKKLWGGRFSKNADTLMERFNASIQIDKRLWKEEISLNTVYAGLLSDTGVISTEETGMLIVALSEIGEEFSGDSFVFSETDKGPKQKQLRHHSILV